MNDHEMFPMDGGGAGQPFLDDSHFALGLPEVVPPVIPWDEQGNLMTASASLDIGAPMEWTGQTTGFTCAVVSQKMVLDAFGIVDSDTGLPVSEARLVYDATSHGWLTDGGTNLADMGNLLDLYGVANHHGSGFESVLNELAQGHRVIVAVDANELWGREHWILNGVADMLGEHPNHALILEGVRMGADGQPVVVVADPGAADGAHREYPLKDFENAFADSGFHYVATDAAPAGFSQDSFIGLGVANSQDENPAWQDWLRMVARATASMVSSVDNGVAKAAVAAGAGVVTVASLSKEKRCDLMRSV